MAVKAKYLTGDSSAISEFIDQFDTFLFDCDGVLWSGEHVFDRVPETLEMLRKKGMQVPQSVFVNDLRGLIMLVPGKELVFVSNNSTKSRAAYKKKLDHLGIECSVDEIFCSSYSAACYISQVLKLDPPKNKVFAIGESGMEEELRAEGIEFIGGTDPALRRDITEADYTRIADGSNLDPNVAIVLTGLDFHINYLKLSLGYAYLQHGATFLATNNDSSLPSANWLFPGAGSIGAPLAKAIDREPTELGKPNQAMMDAIEGKFKLNRGKTCMIGDRLSTDIAFGLEGKLGGTLAVLTGVSKKEDFLSEDAKVVPHAYVDQLGDLVG